MAATDDDGLDNVTIHSSTSLVPAYSTSTSSLQRRAVIVPREQGALLYTQQHPGPADDTTTLLGGDSCPPTRYYFPARDSLVYVCFLCLGLGTLLPWNFFITAESYWQYKFRNSTANGTSVPATTLQTLYTPMQVCFSQVPNFTFLIINALFSHKLPIKQRLQVSLAVMMLLFGVTTAMVKIPSDEWQTTFFAFTMIIIILLNSSGALFQGGLFGLAGMFPSQHMTAVVTGQAIGGVFASFARIVSIMLGANDITSAFIYFLIAVGVMAITMGALYYLTNTEQYANVTGAGKEQETASPEELEPLTAKQLVAHSSRVFREIWPIGLSCSCVFMVTLAVFPAVCVKIVSSAGTDTDWAKLYFQPVLTFLLFNVGDLVGRQLAGYVLWPRRGSKLIFMFVLARVVFIPLLLLCNHPMSPSDIPSVFTSDISYGVIMALFALSNGYLGSLCMIYGPRCVSDPADAERAGSLMAAMLGLGLLLGATTSFGFGFIL